jgi:hypothetical protein
MVFITGINGIININLDKYGSLKIISFNNFGVSFPVSVTVSNTIQPHTENQ